MKLTTKKIYKLIQEQLDNQTAKGIQSIIAKGNLPERYALHVAIYDDVYELVLYQLPPLKPEVAGFCLISKTEKPCIFETYEVRAIARKGGSEYRGLGAIMYDLASTIVKTQHDGGITSDHTVSSSVASYKTWQKMLKSGKYKKRATAISRGKNDKFDYYNSTPADPLDDCDLPQTGVAASDHSLQIINDSPYLDKFMENHEKAIKVAEQVAKNTGKDFDRDEVEDLLEKAGKGLFNKIYKGGTVTVLTKEYFSIWNTIKRAMGSK